MGKSPYQLVEITFLLAHPSSFTSRISPSQVHKVQGTLTEPRELLRTEGSSWSRGTNDDGQDLQNLVRNQACKKWHQHYKEINQTFMGF